MTVLVATDGGIATIDRVGTVGDGDQLAGRGVGPLVVHDGEVWAIVDGREVWRTERGGTAWERRATWSGPPLTCLARTPEGLVVGTAEAHVLRLEGDQLQKVASFDELPERGDWYTPWGAPPDVRSMAVDGDSLLVNVHVGGVARRDGDAPWRALVDIDVDVHQVAVAPDGSVLTATGAAGFGRSSDGGSTWRWDDDGLHGSYCRAVAVAGDQVLLTASTGPGRTRGAVYRRPLGADSPWQRVSDLLDGNIDTFWLAAAGDRAAFVTQDGALWQSDDAGASWSLASEGQKAPRAVAIV
jgi:hypothetical protein